MDDDRELIALAVGGDSRAFERLLAGIEPDLKGFLRALIRTRPEVELDDVLQDLRIYLYQRLDRYNPEYPFLVFAKGLGRNVAKRHLYKRSDLAPILDEEDGEGEAGWADLTPGELSALPVAFRQVLGEGRFESPGGAAPCSREFLELLEAFFRYGGYPHQQAAFGYSILLWGKAKQPGGSGEAARIGVAKVPVTGDPDRVVVEVGPVPLVDSSEGMVGELRETLVLEPEFLDRVRRPLDARLAMTGKELFARDKASLLTFQKLQDATVGLTRLREYFGKDPRKSVADWTHGVKERIKKAVLDPASVSRNPLPAA